MLIMGVLKKKKGIKKSKFLFSLFYCFLYDNVFILFIFKLSILYITCNYRKNFFLYSDFVFFI